jgi:simple sugar transport system permease protein
VPELSALPYRLVLAPRLATPRWLTAATLIGGLLFGVMCCAVFLIAFGVPLSDLGNEFVVYVFGNKAGLDQTFTRAISLVLVSMAVALCLRIRFWNIGVEGQLWMGAIGATAVTFYHIGPWFLRMPLMIVAAAAGGALWCGIAAVAKIKLRADEVITTLLLNYVAYLFAQDLLYGPWRNPSDSFPMSPLFASYERLPTFPGWHLHYGIFIALIVTAFCWWLCRYSRFGLLSKAVAENRTASRALGLPVGRITLATACLAGAVAGLAGFSITAGEEHRLTQFVGNDFIFPSIAIAYLGRANPLGVFVAAIAVAGIYTAGDSLKAFYQLPNTVVVTMEAFLLLTVAACDVFVRYRITLLRTHPKMRKATTSTAAKTDGEGRVA